MSHKNATDRYTEVFAGILKVGATVEDNEDGSTSGEGVMDEVHKGDVGKEVRTLEPTSTEVDAPTFSPTVRKEFIESRRKTLGEMFGGKDKASSQARADVRKVVKSDYESRSPLLEKAAGDRTLADQLEEVGLRR